VIANAAADDKLRSELATRLVDLKPGICVRIIEGYREETPWRDASEGQSTWHYLTKGELLEWANDAVGSVARLAFAN
jgi:hypothetical protein